MADRQSPTAASENATLKEVIGRIAKSSTIALVMPEAPGIDVIGSAVALAAGLRRLEKTVSVFAPPALPPPLSLPLSAASGEDEPLREFVISFDLTRSPIKELKYERDQNRLNIILSPTGGRIRREDVEFRSGLLRYDLVITLGVPRVEAAAASIARVPELLYEKPVLNLDVSPENTRYGELNLVLPPTADQERRTLPELVCELLAGLEARPETAEEATALLVALAAATAGFNLSGTTASAFRLASELIAAGADASMAERLLGGGERLPVAKLAARALVRSRYEPLTATLWSLLTADDFSKTECGAGAAAAALEHLTRLLPHAERYILLMEPAHGEPVRSRLFAADLEEREALAARAGFDRDGQQLVGRHADGSFPAAEARIAQLLRDHDPVE